MLRPLMFDNLFVIFPTNFDGTPVNEAFYTEAAGHEGVRRRTRHNERVVSQGGKVEDGPFWLVRLTTEEGTLGMTQGLKRVWVLIDQDNGNPELIDGKLFVFCFGSKIRADAYKKDLDEKRASDPKFIQVTKPYGLFWVASIPTPLPK